MIEAIENVGGVDKIIARVSLNRNGSTTIRFTPTGTLIRLRFRSSAGVWRLTVRTVCQKVPVMEQESYLVKVCDDEGDKYRFGFNGQEKVNEWSGVGNFMEFSERGQDTRIGRFLSVDPIARQYPWNSPYAFAENSPISGIDLEGLEYLNANDARIEFRYGRLRIKVENLHRWDRNAIRRANNDPNVWKKGDIGINTTLANILFTAPANQQTEASDIPETNSMKAVENYQSTGGNRPARRAEQRNGPAIQGPMGAGRGFAKASIVVDAAKMAAEQYIKWCGIDDVNKINKGIDVAKRVESDVKGAINLNMIPPQYMNKESLTNIMNVILQGENNTNDPGIYKTGMDIYNHFNPQPHYEPSGLDNVPGKSYPVKVIQPSTNTQQYPIQNR